MFPVKTILHPTDFSAPSISAFEMAGALARDYSARLILFHVQPVAASPELEPLQPRNDYKEKLWEEFRKLQESDPRIRELRVETVLREGHPAVEILRMANEIGCDLIVMGTHGRTGLGRLLMGSVAEQVVRQAICPVLTIKSVPIEKAAAPSKSRSASTREAIAATPY
jgi:nucleotide-binding universal stress UspA family protein